MTVRAAGGYKDNVLLSAQSLESSAFLGTGIELLGWTAVGDQGEFQAFVVGEHRQFVSGDDLEKEQTFVAEARLEEELGGGWTLSSPAEYTYVDQVLDVSATEDVVAPTRVQGHTLAARPALRWRVSTGTFETRLTGLRQWYAAPLDDTWETGVRLDWAPDLPGRTRANIYYDFSQAWYDEEVERNSSGLPLEGTQRKTQRHEGGLRVRHEWGEADAWRLTARIGGRYASDQASGYYDYARPSMSLRLRHQQRTWLVETGLRLSHYRYLVQQTDSGSDRQRLELVADTRGELELLPWLRAFAEYSYEETFANGTFPSYSVNTVQAGFEMTF